MNHFLKEWARDGNMADIDRTITIVCINTLCQNLLNWLAISGKEQLQFDTYGRHGSFVTFVFCICCHDSTHVMTRKILFFWLS
jgi:hypothetical protein